MITTERLHELVHYNPQTGVMTWTGEGREGKASKYPWLAAGKPVGSLNSNGYREICIDGHRTYIHRLAWQYVYDVIPPHHIDHINGDKLDNRILNLRVATAQLNCANTGASKNSKSGVKGVVQREDRWLAYIHVDRKTRYLGSFGQEWQAKQAYLEAAIGRWGEYARDD